MSVWSSLLLLFCLGGNPDTHTTPPSTYIPVHLNGHAQGTTWKISYYSPFTPVNSAHIDSILKKLDTSMSLYKPYSLICQFNLRPDILPDPMGPEKPVNALNPPGS
jgi:thiamine biosynthesis lipoprotein